MKKKLLCGIIAMGMLLMVGCGGTDNKDQDANAKPPVTDEADKNDDKNDKDESEDNKENESNEDAGSAEEKLDQVKIENGELAVYVANENIDGVKIGTTIKTKDLTIKENLEKIAEELEKNNFKGCDIEVSDIVKEGNKNIVTINLKDDEKTWEQEYFQGSTGAFITEETLIKSFLQPKNKMEWIDAIKFTVNGKSGVEFNHAPRLNGTIDRESK